MATERANPYGTFNYLVDLGTGVTGSVKAGFQEVTGLSIEVTSADYRNGNEGVNHPRKINGVYKVGDITLKRGLMGALLYDDCQEDDARLCVENILHAAELGAVCVNYCELSGFVKRDGRITAAPLLAELAPS